MATINYQFADGHYRKIKVSEELRREYSAMIVKERRLERKETRRHISLDMLIELEERQNNQGSLENKLLKRGQETFSLISRELDPLEILLREEQTENTPIAKALSLGLTDYQRKIAVEFYINNKTHMQIARELGLSRPAVSKIIKKVQKKAIKSFK